MGRGKVPPFFLTSTLLPICVNLAGKVERRKRAGKYQVEIVLTIRLPNFIPPKQL
jgi:hypothetical protein